jgi:8-oxo-dGTP diphosphatase
VSDEPEVVPAPTSAARGRSIHAAGVLLWRPDQDRPGDIQIGLVHRVRQQDWSLPKGKLQGSEGSVLAAVRETLEETGQRVTLGRPLPTQHYPVEGDRKHVRYWVAEGDGRPFVPNAEVDVLAWLPPAQARDKLSYLHDADVLDAFLAGPRRTSPLVVLRHGRAKKRAQWKKPERDLERPLERRGFAQAERLVDVLHAFGVRTVHSSDATRCIQTVEPFAASLAAAVPPGDGTIHAEPALSEPGHAAKPAASRDRAVELLADRRALVVCSHRPVLPDMLAVLLDGWTGRPPHALPPGHFLVLHRAADDDESWPTVVSVEHHKA